jgi:hypothetical protein
MSIEGFQHFATREKHKVGVHENSLKQKITAIGEGVQGMGVPSEGRNPSPFDTEQNSFARV